MKTLLIAVVLWTAACASSQLTSITPAPDKYGGLGVEVQVYPAGIIPGVHLRHRLSKSDVLTLRLAANLTERGDWGEHADETGDGWGGGIGWRRALSGDIDSNGWWFGARADLWDMSIDWEDPGPRTGTTDILVLQPSAEFGYGWSTKSAGRFEFGAGLGVEINVDTDGEDVGEGVIFLLGLTWLP